MKENHRTLTTAHRREMSFSGRPVEGEGKRKQDLEGGSRKGRAEADTGDRKDKNGLRSKKSSREEHRVDAKAPFADEGRDQLRKAAGSRK